MKYEVEFNYPKELDNPYPKYVSMLELMHKEFGNEQVNMMIEAISCKWANMNGYNFTIEGNKLVFTHVFYQPIKKCTL